MGRYKGRSCIVPFCNSGFKSCKEKRTLLSVPSDSERLLEWKKAIPRQDYTLQSGQVVCELHFLPEQIVRIREVKDPDGKVMASEVLKRPHLVPGAIPSIFLKCPKYLSNNEKKRKTPEKRSLDSPQRKKSKVCGVEIASNEIKIRNLENVKTDPNQPDDSLNLTPKIEPVNSPSNNPPDIPFTDSPPKNDSAYLPPGSRSLNSDPDNSSLNKDSADSLSKDEKLEEELGEAEKRLKEQRRKRLILFCQLFNRDLKLSLPTIWSRRQTTNGDTPIIELAQISSQFVGEEMKLVSSKKLLIFDDLEVKVEVMGKTVNLETLDFSGSFVSSIEELIQIIKKIDKAKICSGVAAPDSVRNILNERTYRDDINCLRKQSCPLLILGKDKKSKCTCCKTCRHEKKISARENALRLQNKQDSMRIKLGKLNISPSEREKLGLIRKRLRNSMRSKFRFERLYRESKEELRKCQKEMASINEKRLETKILNLNIRTNERTCYQRNIEGIKAR